MVCRCEWALAPRWWSLAPQHCHLRRNASHQQVQSNFGAAGVAGTKALDRPAGAAEAPDLPDDPGTSISDLAGYTVAL